MKVALLISALAGANAFAPASQSRAATSLAASAELDNMRGLGPENGYTVVRELRGVCSCHRCRYIKLSHCLTNYVLPFATCPGAAEISDRPLISALDISNL